MREFKFRVWDSYHQEMINWSQYKDELVSEDFINHGKGPLVVMQYTGASDKNGIKIYEGDIVTFTYVGEPRRRHKKYKLKTGKEKIGTVIYDDYECCYYIEFLSLWKGMYDVELYKDLTYKNIRDVDNLEVIGNIYENADLLEVENGI